MLRHRPVAIRKTLSIVLTVLVALPALAYNERPLIGIVSQPCLPGVCGVPADSPETSYIGSFLLLHRFVPRRATVMIGTDL
jgi:hypothetical protein